MPLQTAREVNAVVAASVGTPASVGRSALRSLDGTALVQAAGSENTLVVATRSLDM
ncbi:MAG: hypothetical protein U0840_02740 [Gemmataceae bacterium]